MEKMMEYVRTMRSDSCDLQEIKIDISNFQHGCVLTTSGHTIIDSLINTGTFRIKSSPKEQNLFMLYATGGAWYSELTKDQLIKLGHELIGLAEK
jgi:hypothetical protein